MNAKSQPLISVVTPVYNGEPYLAECIESVLKQTYRNFEYIIVNNCSTDRTLEIASSYAKDDPRIRIHDNDTFVPVIENHNTAFRLISPAAKYCKVVSADDSIFPDCLLRMVELAEANPSVGFVGSFEIAGSRVRWQGFEYPRAVISGRELCRRVFLSQDPEFGFGSPTSLMYRADIVRGSGEFYPNASPHADTSACFKHLEHSDFGFVYEVLAYCRIHGETQSSGSQSINRYSSAVLNDVIQYGPLYLSPEEFRKLLRKQIREYYQFLGVNMFGSRGKEFWRYHRSRLEELGHPLTIPRLLAGVVTKLLREAVNPGQAAGKVRRYFTSRLSRPAGSDTRCRKDSGPRKPN